MLNEITRAKRKKGSEKSECSWKCQTLSMQQGLKCQAACQGSSLACQACSDHATGESVGTIVCYKCADGDQTKRWYAAKEKGKKHFLLCVTVTHLTITQVLSLRSKLPGKKPILYCG
jgi:hypothetical protein